ncbi:relaxase/mobilization nuclease domain-containing protein [Hymenobacter sp. H14-R3]|uniref:relaxase/mobilization nuclease domain-containing protein n=1 Tax=Hymenobacter sp. H14-R3 TaxID=3046308 RepID=UPI0024BBD10A|nr:relaxase/mobilization nuclease domain-containing protein [Hymenobacter sp. H14-R3]MDJ0367986.1 relaxase/mobilization nuclease domain-containing protein [Hymenobacter sp. H14-R3]
MISRTSIGRSFGGVVRYQFEGRKEQPSDKQAEVLAAVGVRSDSAAHMSADFNRGRQLNPNLGQAVWHTSLSFNPDDAAKLDSAKMLAIAEGYVQKMGLDKTQYAIIRHHDQSDNQHLHIIANRVGDDGQTIKDGHNFYHSKKALKELIQEHGLTPPQGLRVDRQHAPSDKAELAKYEIKQALHQALATAPDRPALLATLRAEKISAHEFTNKAGTVTGISFEKDGHAFKGSAVARAYSLAGLDKQLAANQERQQAEQARQVAAQEAAAQQLRQVAVELAHRQAAERQAAQVAQQQEAARQAAQVAQRQEADRQAAQLAQRQAAERQAAEAAKVPALPAVERKWQPAYQQYAAELAQQNAPVQAYNKIIDSYSQYLKAKPNEEGIQDVVKLMKGDSSTATLRAELDRQVAARAMHANQWADSYGQQAALQEQAKGGFWGKWVKREATQLAEEKLKFLTDKDRPLPGLLEPDLLAFARAAKAADQPAPPIGFEARAYYQPEQGGLNLTAYAAKREAERQLVVRVQEPVGDIQAAGRAEALQRSLTSKGATVSASTTADAQGNRVIDLTVQYSVQQPRSEVKEISLMLDWAAERPGYQVQEQKADRAQRQAPGQQDAQREQARTPDKSQGMGFSRR